uniref:Uncharacterized protein AlNc14C31G2861 n=1 Tax=Albugo laibachii Nc14 TaxID=890382 RepID=F0W7Q7_9STRA|nr:conserved hypothetical protein [Albugo laibachii Nc14]|eukprot:CCA17158.1 conserved hypothetical protein [Albugo laibachii Nc14]
MSKDDEAKQELLNLEKSGMHFVYRLIRYIFKLPRGCVTNLKILTKYRRRHRFTAFVLCVVTLSCLIFRLPGIRRVGVPSSPTTRPVSVPAPPTNLKSPLPQADSEKKDVAPPRTNCRQFRDYGMISELRRTALFVPVKPIQKEASRIHTTVTHYRSGEANMLSTKCQHLALDLRNVKGVYRPITSIAQEGHMHDPRYVYSEYIPRCVSGENLSSANKVPNLWGSLFHNTTKKGILCTRISASELIQDGVDFKKAIKIDSNKVIKEELLTSRKYLVKTNALVISRRDDHNPFFQTSVALNAWIMLQVVKWDTSNTQIVYLDQGFPNALEQLHKRMLAPNHPVITGKMLQGRMFHFENALTVPFELNGPMMVHLNDDEPCHYNQMLDQFRLESLRIMGVETSKMDKRSCTITILSRRPYQGRKLNRCWLNEDEILNEMIKEYSREGFYRFGICTFQSLDFVTFSMEKQMHIMIESDIVIGMHGAGMVNILWARPHTNVIEIFPHKKKRWGYRNICQLIGCSWEDFRGGIDGPSQAKNITYTEWKDFFDPILRSKITALERQAML